MTRVWDRIDRWLGSRYAPLVAWVSMFLLVAGALFGTSVNLHGLADAADERTRAACEGARDTRQVVIDLIEFSGEAQLDPDDYTGELRAAVAKANRRGERFRNTTIKKLEIPPSACALVKPPE